METTTEQQSHTFRMDDGREIDIKLVAGQLRVYADGGLCILPRGGNCVYIELTPNPAPDA